VGLGRRRQPQCHVRFSSIAKVGRICCKSCTDIVAYDKRTHSLDKFDGMYSVLTVSASTKHKLSKLPYHLLTSPSKALSVHMFRLY
jgi:hypothetical protein